MKLIKIKHLALAGSLLACHALLMLGMSACRSGTAEYSDSSATICFSVSFAPNVSTEEVVRLLGLRVERMYTKQVLFDEWVTLAVGIATRDAQHDLPSLDPARLVQLELAAFASMAESDSESSLPEGWAEDEWRQFQEIFSSSKLRDARRRVVEHVSPLLAVHGTTAFSQAQSLKSADQMLTEWPYDTSPPDDLVSPLPITEQNSNLQLMHRAHRIRATLMLAMIDHGDIRFSSETTEHEVVAYLKEQFLDIGKDSAGSME